jgi:hypothetical protein
MTNPCALARWRWALVLVALGGCADAPESLCAQVTCPLSQACDTSSGLCTTVSVCMGVVCAAGQVCDGTPDSPAAGTCVTSTCGASACRNGQVCDPPSLTCVNPGVPRRGVQIDRVGRPLINTLLTNPFDLYRPPAATVNDTSDQTRAAYNADSGSESMWVKNWSPAIAQHLGYFDGLDGQCSSGSAATNQLGFGVTLPAYGLLARVLASDQLLVDTSRTVCKTYLAVEQRALGLDPTLTDCGGRTLDIDVVDRTYTLLTNPTMPLSDGVTRAASASSAFPYFPPPL